MNRPGSRRQQLVIWGLILGLWALLVLTFAGQLVFANQLPWRHALALSLRDWLPWAVLAPAVAWLAAHFPFERSRLVVSIPVHLAGCMTAVLLCQTINRLSSTHSRPAAAIPPGELRQDLPPPERPLPGPEGLMGQPPEHVRPRPPLDRAAPLLPPEDPRRMFMDNLVTHAKFNLPIYWIVVSLVQAMTYLRRAQDRELKARELEARLADAKLDALRMQLHPHFLFNTLNAISTLVHKDPHAADEMIANLSELLRATLDTSSQEIPLRRELEFLDRYLEIQQSRFGDRLKIEKEIELATLDALVPTLILQPLVENAIRHGVERLTDQGLVRICVGRSDHVLRLAVQDNGPGDKPPTRPPSQPGIGLANTKARLQELYGSRAQLTLGRAEAQGYLAVLELPYRDHENSRPAG